MGVNQQNEEVKYLLLPLQVYTPRWNGFQYFDQLTTSGLRWTLKLNFKSRKASCIQSLVLLMKNLKNLTI